MSVRYACLRGVTPPRRLAVTARRRAVDGVAVRAQPLSHFSQPCDALEGNLPLRRRGYVEQEVSALRRDIHERPDENLGAFPIVVERLKAPVVVDRHAGLPVDAGKSLGWNLLLRRAEIAESDASSLRESVHPLSAVADAIVHDETRLDGSHVAQNLAPAVVVPIGNPFSIEPEDVDGWILREELLELRLEIRLDIAREIRIRHG